jgi:hypothetical protein
MIEIKDTELKEAASKGYDAFLNAFAEKYKSAINNASQDDKLQTLNGAQHTLLAYTILKDELLEGGFCQLIQNGYGDYIFNNPFAKAMRLWGLKDFSNFIYSAKKIYDYNKEDLLKERTDDEFMAMYEQYENFNDLDDSFIENEEEITSLIAKYVDEHIDEFAKIVK